ncbi:hypothetical protein BGX26_009818 [Mortierella sp. AD094]|nr:hypothetical protein BGX26_009818 [Mortierella sp. AD094]
MITNDRPNRHAARAVTGEDPRPANSKEGIVQTSAATKIASPLYSVKSRIQDNNDDAPKVRQRRREDGDVA